MSIKTENLAGSEEQQQRQAIAEAAVDKIIQETPAQISIEIEMYARSVALAAFAEGWNSKADEELWNWRPD